MTARQFILPLAHELVVDLFAGGGGASTGIEQALGRHVDIAVNRGHDGRVLSKAAQVRMCGNSVCPPVAAAIVRANFVEVDLREAA
jgi:site-specific DNA-cytosine methylase